LIEVNSYADIANVSQMKISNLLGVTKTRIDSRLMAADGDLNAIGESSNPSARSYYARGRELYMRYNLSDQERSIESFQKAVEIDANYGKAYAMLASACQARARVHPEGEWLERAEAAAADALRVAPMLSEAYRAHAGNLRLRGQVRSSIDAYLIAYELDPSDARATAALGNIYGFVGRPDLGIVWFEKATHREIRPLYADSLGEAWADLGEYEEAEKAFTMGSVFRPDVPTWAVGLSKLAFLRGDQESARRQCESARIKYKDDPLPLVMAAMIEFFGRNFDAAEKLYREASTLHRTGGINFSGSVRFSSAVGYIQTLSDSRAVEGRALLEEARKLDERELALAAENAALSYSLAANNAALGDIEPAILALNKAIAAGWIDYRSMMLDPRFDSIRGTQPFKDILARLTNKVAEMRRDLPSRRLASTGK
jgi:tetratricopeptide (TPR) repeat protein